MTLHLHLSAQFQQSYQSRVNFNLSRRPYMHTNPETSPQKHFVHSAAQQKLASESIPVQHATKKRKRLSTSSSLVSPFLATVPLQTCTAHWQTQAAARLTLSLTEADKTRFAGICITGSWFETALLASLIAQQLWMHEKQPRNHTSA